MAALIALTSLCKHSHIDFDTVCTRANLLWGNQTLLGHNVNT